MLLYRQRASAESAHSFLREGDAADISPLMRQLLASRGITTDKAINEFLRPSAENMHDPFLMTNMRQICDRIERAVSSGERICVYGDYDCDGVTSSSILSMYLRSRGADVEVYIPSRHAEGYGLNMNALQELTQRVSLIITVDCGISNVQEVAYVKGVGCDIIVTDHHQLPPQLPDCLCLNPLMGDYPFRRLCGAGVALKLVQALGGADAAAPYWDLAAIGTIADIVPLLDENRVIVSLGLAALNQNMRVGVKALCAAAGIKPDEQGNYKLRAGQIAFTIAPRINAGGRMETAGRCVELLTCTDERRAGELAEYVNLENAERQAQERAVIEAAEASLDKEDFTRIRALIVCGEGWNPGVIGLAASRLKEKYNYPTLVFTRVGDNYVGSCRSIDGVDMFKSLSTCSELFLRFGGHPMAAGLTLPVKNMAEFARRFNEYLFKTADPKLYFPTVEYDAELSPEQLDIDTIRELELLQPTGCGNPEPVFRIQADVANGRRIGQSGTHIKLTLNVGKKRLDGLGWGMADRMEGLIGTRRDIICALGINEYNGNVTPQAVIKEIQPLSANDAINAMAQTAQEDNVIWLDTVLAASDQNRVEPIEITEKQLVTLLKRSYQGVLMNADSPAILKRTLVMLCGNGLIDLPDVCHGFPQDRRAFNALCLCGVGLPPVGYRYYVALGDLVDPSQLNRMNAAGLKVLMLKGAKRHANLKPSDDAMREVYKYLVQNKLRLVGVNGIYMAASSIARATGTTPAQVVATLHIFRELKLLTLKDRTRQIELLPMHKVELSDSAIYRMLDGE